MSPRYKFDFGAESGEDAVVPVATLRSKLDRLEEEIQILESTGEAKSIESARLHAQACWISLELGPGQETWARARPLFDAFFETEAWEEVIDICELLFLSDQPESITALGQGVWLSVTFPVNPGITCAMLRHVIEETPDDADGAAVAAATAVYVYQLREKLASEAGQYVDAMEMLTSVARQHSNIHNQAELDGWMEKLELDQPEKFLVRLRNVLDVLVQDNWWFDRHAVQRKLPD